MRPDQKFEPEDEELRQLLREWTVPSPPPEIAADLRRTFRRNRAPRRSVTTWLAVAATVATVIGGVHLLRQVSSTSVRRAVADRAPSPPPSEAAEPSTRPGGERSTPTAGVRTAHRSAPQRRPEAEVIVEPRQAELLAQLAGQLRRLQEAPPTVRLPQVEELLAYAASAPTPEMPDAEVPTLHTEWEVIQGTWPAVHRPL